MRVQFRFITAAGTLGLIIAAGGALLLRADVNGSPVEGRRLFLKENCYSCHGGRAGGAMCPNLRDDRPDFGDVLEVLRNGTDTGMPAFPDLTVQDAANLAAYFQSLRTPQEPTFTHWWEPVPSQ